MLKDAFPKERCRDVQAVLDSLARQDRRGTATGQRERCCRWTLLTGEEGAFPYRIYDPDRFDALAASLSPVQKVIYSCIFSRSHNGFVREKHVKAILSSGSALPD